MSNYRKGFVLHMWTGCFPINRWGQPVIYRTRELAERVLARFPSWGHAAVDILPCRTRPGSNGKRDYILSRST